MNKVFRTIHRMAVVLMSLVLVFAFGSCSKNAPIGGGNPPVAEQETDSEMTDIATPQVPELDTGTPSQALPELDDEALVGEADLQGATAVIYLAQTTAYADSPAVTVLTHATHGTIVEIAQSGTFVVQGTLAQGFVAIAKKDLSVTLVLNGVNIYCDNYAPIVCLKKSAVVVELAKNSFNYLTDGGKEVDADGKFTSSYDAQEQPNATLLIRENLTVRGSGSLTVNANANNGIASRANLVIEGGTIAVNAKNNAIKGNDSVRITGGDFTLTAVGDGIKSDEDAAQKGAANIDILGGSFLITTQNGDAVQAESALTIADASFMIRTGGGSAAKATADSTKGLKAATTLTIDSGTFEIDSNDDAVHGGELVVIHDATLMIASGDDGIHADKQLTINGGNIQISRCYEGLEAQYVDLNGGYVRLIAADDGINISNGVDASGAAENRPGLGGFRPGQGGGGGQFTPIDGALTITGGKYYISASGDGLDSNGNIVISGGWVVVHGPVGDPDVPVDYDGTFAMTGGVLVALGSAGSMAQQPDASSTQYTFLAKFNQSVAADKLLHVRTSDGEEIVTVKTQKSSKGLVVCMPSLQKGSYEIVSGGTHSGFENTIGLYVEGEYSGGEVLKAFTIQSIVTVV